MRPGYLLATSIGLPVALTVLLVLYTYSPALPGYAPRHYPRPLFWFAFVLAVGLFQLLPFASWSRRLFLTLAFFCLMWVVIFTVYFFGACSYGDCF